MKLMRREVERVCIFSKGGFQSSVILHGGHGEVVT